MNSVVLVIELLSLAAQVVPKIAPMIKDLLEMIKGMPVEDITHEELVVRVDAAIAKLPSWE